MYRLSVYRVEIGVDNGRSRPFFLTKSAMDRISLKSMRGMLKHVSITSHVASPICAIEVVVEDQIKTLSSIQ